MPVINKEHVNFMMTAIKKTTAIIILNGKIDAKSFTCLVTFFFPVILV